MADFPLSDRYGRQIEYLRLSVTDRCDLRCSYCLPAGFIDFEPTADWLDFDEIERVVGAFARLGLKRLRLTGGEPLTRRGLPELAARLHAIAGIDDLSLSTNGTLLAGQAAELRRGGVSRLNVSLDTLSPQRFAAITGRDALAAVQAGLETAGRQGFAPIKINMVPMAGVNEDEIDAMVAYCIERGYILRLIEAMPMGMAGRAARRVDLQPVRERLQQRFGLVDGVVPGGGPARYLKSPDGRFSVGFITPVSQHFCATCNRVRLSVEGTLYLCLGQEDRVELRPLLRGGIDDAGLIEAIRVAIGRKPERHDFVDAPQKIIRVMAQTGG